MSGGTTGSELDAIDSDAPSPDVAIATGPAPWRAWPMRREWRDAIALVAVTRIVFLVLAWANARMRDESRLADGWVAIWRRWDADIYAKIAEHGYTTASSEPFSEAFPPTWPLLLRLGATVTGASHTAVALALTTVATVVAVAFLIRWVDEGAMSSATAPSPRGTPLGATALPLSAGRRGALLLLVFPTAVFLVVGYSEALFLAGAIPAFRAARAGRWGPGLAVALAVAVAARWAGLFLLVALGVELMRQRPAFTTWLRGAVALGVGALPAVAYATWLWVVHHDPLYFLEAQTRGWDRRFVGPVESFRATWNAAFPAVPDPLVVAWRAELLAAAVGVALVVVLVRRREWAAAVFCGGLLAALMTSTWYYSVPRVALTFFPLFPLLARWSLRRSGRFELLLLAFAPIAALGVVQVTRGGWFH